MDELSFCEVQKEKTEAQIFGPKTNHVTVFTR